MAGEIPLIYLLFSRLGPFLKRTRRVGATEMLETCVRCCLYRIARSRLLHSTDMPLTASKQALKATKRREVTKRREALRLKPCHQVGREVSVPLVAGQPARECHRISLQSVCGDLRATFDGKIHGK